MCTLQKAWCVGKWQPSHHVGCFAAVFGLGWPFLEQPCGLRNPLHHHLFPRQCLLIWFPTPWHLAFSPPLLCCLVASLTFRPAELELCRKGTPLRDAQQSIPTRPGCLLFMSEPFAHNKSDWPDRTCVQWIEMDGTKSSWILEESKFEAELGSASFGLWSLG